MKKSELKTIIRAIVTEVRKLKLENSLNHDPEYDPTQRNPEDQAEFDRQMKRWKASKGSRVNKWNDDVGYDVDDPKHPGWTDRMIRRADMADYEKEDLQEDGKLGASTMKKSADKKDNTQMGYEDKTITSTSNPTEKKEGEKLPVKEKGSNTETNHFAKKKSTATPPVGEKKEGTTRPVGGNAPEKNGGMSLKEEIVKMIRESLEEMAKIPVSYDGKRLVGSISNNLRQSDPNSPTGWSLVSDYKLKNGTIVPKGTPVDAPKNTGLNYGKVAPKAQKKPKKDDADAIVEPPEEDTGYTFTFVDPSGDKFPLDPELPWYSPTQLNSYMEKNVMGQTGDLNAKLDPSVNSLLNTIKMRPETVKTSNFILKYDKNSQSVKMTPSV